MRHGTSGACPAAKAAAVADGAMIEVHPEPSKALSDGQQSLTIEAYANLAAELSDLAAWRPAHS